MPDFSFDPKVSLGHLLTIAAFIVTIVAGWQAFDGRVSAVEINDAKQDGKIDTLAASNIEIGKTLAEIGIDLGYLRRWVEEERRERRAAEAAP